jgi:hypothetical protein
MKEAGNPPAFLFLIKDPVPEQRDWYWAKGYCMKQKLWIVIGVGVLLVAGLWYGMSRPKALNTNTNSTANTNEVTFEDQCTTPAATTANINGTVQITAVTYNGSDGKNALELLQASHTVDASAAGFVNAIDGVKPGDHEFWLLCVNGKGAEVGAKDLVTSSSDRIEWRLGTF